MFLTRALCLSLVCCATFLSSATAATKPMVVGYLVQDNHSDLTINGSRELSVRTYSVEHQEVLSQDLEHLSRELNQMIHGDHFDPQKIIPVIQDNHYQICYDDRVLLQITPLWAQAYKSSKLKTLLTLTNTLRNKMGAEKLTRFTALRQIEADQTGLASWYGGYFQGRLTANGERYDVAQLTAAHKHLPFGTKVLVTNLDNQQSVLVKINDRGPFKAKRVIDLSPAAFEKIGYLGQGVLKVKLTIVS